MIARIVRPDDGVLLNPQTEPLAMLNIDRFGRVSTYSPELLGYENAAYNDFIIGDIFKNSLKEMYETCERSALNAAIQEGVRRVRRSAAISGLRRRSPVNKLFETDSFESDANRILPFDPTVCHNIILTPLDRLAQKR